MKMNRVGADWAEFLFEGYLQIAIRRARPAQGGSGPVSNTNLIEQIPFGGPGGLRADRGQFV